MDRLHFKTELCDGEVHMTAHEFAENRDKARMYKILNRLKRVANNPILNEETQNAVWYAIMTIETDRNWRQKYIELKEQYEKLKKEKRK